MRLTNYFLPILALFCLGLPGCSGNDDVIPGEKEPLVPEKKYDAVFSLAIQQNQKQEADTKASLGENHWKSYDYITNLNLIVFDANEELVAFKETRVPEGDASSFGIHETDTLHVPSGRVKVLVLANVDIASQLRKMGTSLRDFSTLKGVLKDEIVGKLSMSSDLLTFDLRTGWNFAGFGSKGNATVDYKGNQVEGLELTGQPVKLVRNVSSVFLYGLNLKPAPDFKGYEKVEFHLKSLFLANVKAVSKIFDPAGDKWGSVEVPSAEADWVSGAFGDMSGALKENEARVWNSLFYDFTNPPADIDAYNERYFYLNGFWNSILQNGGKIDGRDVKGNLEPIRLICERGTDIATLNHANGDGILPVGVDFYIYENKNDDDDHTLLVVCGDYTYTPVKGQLPVTLKDRYYTLVVNKDGENEDNSETKHVYIRKNYKYVISLTIAGTGSDIPFDPLSTAHVSAQIKVRDWDEVIMDPSVD